MKNQMKSLKKVYFDDPLEQPRFFLSTDPPKTFFAEPLWRESKVTGTQTTPLVFHFVESDPSINLLEPQTTQNLSYSWQPVMW